MERQKEFIGHRIAKEGFEPVEAILYEYLLAANGVLLRAQREEFTVSVPLVFREIKGLPTAFVGIRWHKPKVPSRVWDEICKHAQISNSKENFREELYLVYWDSERYAWQWSTSSRDRTYASTIADDRRPEYSEACIELHTHPPGAIHFSRADDLDESGKFRFFAILVDIHDTPQIRFRCGIYDQFFQIPAAWVGDIPTWLIDLNEIDLVIEKLFT